MMFIVLISNNFNEVYFLCIPMVDITNKLNILKHTKRTYMKKMTFRNFQ